MRLFPPSLFGAASTKAPQEAPCAAIQQAADYLCIATVDASGKRIRENAARSAVRLLDSLLPEDWRP